MRESTDEVPAIVVEGVTKRFGRKTVLDGVTFSLRRGETACFLGGSGTGKSTLLKIVIGALAPDEGRVVMNIKGKDGSIRSHDVTALEGRRLDEVRRNFGVMFQGGALLNSLTVAENVALPLEQLTRNHPNTIRAVVTQKLFHVDLLDRADVSVAALSGGQRKRAAVARAIALDPQILFYDEPSAGLDPITTTKMDVLINKLKTVLGITSIVVTHVMESVQRIADHIIMLDAGRVILDGTLDELLQSPDPRIQDFVRGDLGHGGDDDHMRQEFYNQLLG